MYDLIVTILSSSAISSLIVVISNIFLNQKKNSIEYITGERKVWRQEIREIAEEIEKADENNINIPLTKLKVRINAYDYFEQNQQDSGDYVLWNLISICEKKYNPDTLRILKKNVIMLISLMLKYDWERSKKEISIDKNDLLIPLCVIIQLSIYLLLRPLLGFDIKTIVELVINYVAMLIMMNLVIEVHSNRIRTNKRGDKIWFNLGIYAVFFIIILCNIVIGFSENDMFLNGTANNIIQKITLVATVMLPTEILILLDMDKSSLLRYRRKYVDSLQKLIKDMEKELFPGSSK